jgi:hypothetical protein
MSKSKDRAASCTSKIFSDQGAGRNGFAKRNYSTHPRGSSASTQLKWEVKAKKFLLGLLALTSLLVLSARVTLYVSLFRSTRHDVATQLAQSESRLAIKLTEPYVGSTRGVEKMKVMEMESSTDQNNRDHAADQLVVETDATVEMESTDQNTRLDHDVQLVQAVETETLESYKVVDSADAIAFLDELTLNLTGTDEEIDNGPYHSRRVFEANYDEMNRNIKIFVYPYPRNDPYRDIYRAWESRPSGNYASEAYFKQALMKSSYVTSNAAEADFFFMPVSITRARMDKRVGTEGVKRFCKKHVTSLRNNWSYWNRTGGVDHFYLSCHSIARTAMELVPYVRQNAIQLVCPSSYHLHYYITHKDASVPQIWPRDGGTPQGAKHIAQRKRLAFFAGSLNSNVRVQLQETWQNDDEILIHSGKVTFPYSEGLLTSKFCLHVKGFEVNTARLGDAMFYGCVPVVIANYYDLPYADVLDWHKFSIVVPTFDIPLLKEILKSVTPAQYTKMHQYVLQVRQHFQWHTPAREFDAFYMVMYELWIRRHTVRNSLQ